MSSLFPSISIPKISLFFPTLKPQEDVIRPEEKVISTPRKTPLEKRLPILRASREARNNLTLQQTLCICLLSPFCNVVIKRPQRKSLVTEQFFKVSRFEFSKDDFIDVSSFIKMRGDQKLKHDMALGASKKTATRRYQNNKKIEVIHLMEDLLLELGFELITKTLSGKNGVNRLESILEASRNGSSITFKSLTTGLVKTNHKLLKIVSKSKSEYSVNSKVFNIQKVVELNHPDLD